MKGAGQTPDRVCGGGWGGADITCRIATGADCSFKELPTNAAAGDLDGKRGTG